MDYINKIEAEITTPQQEVALREYKKALDEACFMPAFWDWYWHYCLEECLYDDRTSNQFDDVEAIEQARYDANNK